MKYNFSSDFLKVISPHTSFAEVWETICYTLLKQEHNEHDIINLKAPENGIDIWRPAVKNAYQCKSNEHGKSMDMSKIIKSLSSALSVRNEYNWKEYLICVNARITGRGHEKLLEYKKSNGLSESEIKILDVYYWSELAEKHIASIEKYLDYRLLVTENEVKTAFEKARYYDEYILKFISMISNEPINVRLTNNRTPLSIELPFSLDFTVKQLLNVAKSLFNVDMNQLGFQNLGTQARPSISLLYDGKPQSFNKKIGEVIQSENNCFELRVKIICGDYRQDSKDDTLAYLLTTDKYENRAQTTVKLGEAHYQTNMWASALAIKNGEF